MQRLIGTFLLLAGLSTVALGSAVVAPEIDGASAISALTLVSGAVLVIRSRKR